MALMYYSVISYTTYTQHTYYKVNLGKRQSNLAEITSNTDWLRWKRPEGHHIYMIMWLFELDYHLTINLLSEYIGQGGIINTKLHIAIPKSVYKSILSQLASPPFGRIDILNKSDHDDYVHLEVIWLSSQLLPTNKLLNQFKTSVRLKLKSIIYSKDSWSIKINENWITNKNPRIDSILISKVTDNEVMLAAHTPSGIKELTMRCGDEVVIKYIDEVC